LHAKILRRALSKLDAVADGGTKTVAAAAFWRWHFV
jgi:hypothetical protein